LKFIDKIMARSLRGKHILQQIQEESPSRNSQYNLDDDFDYLNDD
jgi:hypothetical protein